MRHQYELSEFENGKVIFDKAVKLAWQQGGSADSLNYSDAQVYVHKLNSERFAGYYDWRLPTLEEAMSLMEPEKLNSLYINSIFDSKQNILFTSDKTSLDKLWIVDYIQGHCDTVSTVDHAYVRAVRSVY